MDMEITLVELTLGDLAAGFCPLGHSLVDSSTPWPQSPGPSIVDSHRNHPESGG